MTSRRSANGMLVILIVIILFISIIQLVSAYYISGYVLDPSGSSSLNNATVQINASLPNAVTDAYGFYNFSGISNGPYVINASLTGYSPNNISIEVNGSDIINANISLLPIVHPSPQTGGRLIVAINRYVILDDPSGWDGGYAPYGITDHGNQWSGESTTVRWYVLLMNSSGRVISNVSITSNFSYPDGSLALTQISATDSSGTAEFSVDMDRWLKNIGSTIEGVYTIDVSAALDNVTVFGKNNFIYDEWGCGSAGSGCHRSEYWSNSGENSQSASNWASGSIQNSPYLHAWDNFHSSNGHGGDGGIGAGECLTCHRGFDGINRTHSARVTSSPQYPAGIHNGRVGCTECHGDFRTDTIPIDTCYDCHPEKNNNLTIKLLSQSSTGGYSYQPLTDSTIRAHDSNNRIACIFCHDNGHNITKPYYDPGTSNTFTEYQECTSCHGIYERHNGSVSCTVCHSQDAHAIKISSQDAAYVDMSTSSIRGNCTNCHQSISFFGTLMTQPKAGSYSGNIPRVPNPMTHSNDPMAGMKWNSAPGYWVNGTDSTAQYTACIYCHGQTTHNASALGRPLKFMGSNTVNSAVSIYSDWCLSCHFQGYASGIKNYVDMVNSFITDSLPVPPEITGNASFGANESIPSYFNHSDISKDDAACKGCHGSLAAGSSISDFMHNVAVGGDCMGCHFNWSVMNETYNSPDKYVNESMTRDSVHANLSCIDCHTDTAGHPGIPPPRSGWKWCEDCHASQQSPRTNKSRHNIVNNPLNNQYNGISVMNINSCPSCHNSTSYINAVSIYGKDKGIDCDYCHSFPDNVID